MSLSVLVMVFTFSLLFTHSHTWKLILKQEFMCHTNATIFFISSINLCRLISLDLLKFASTEASPVHNLLEAVSRENEKISLLGSLNDYMIGPHYYTLNQQSVHQTRDWPILQKIMLDALKLVYPNEDNRKLVLETCVKPLLNQRRGFKFRPRKSIKIYRFGNGKLLRGMENLNSSLNRDFVSILDPSTYPSTLIFLRVQFFLPISFWDVSKKVETLIVYGNLMRKIKNGMLISFVFIGFPIR